MLEPSKIIADISPTVEKMGNYLLNHPVLDLIVELKNAKFCVSQYLHFAAEIPRITGLRYGMCHDENIRRQLLSVMIEEEGYGQNQSKKSHYLLAQLTAKSIGINAEPEIHFSTITMLASLEMQYISSLIAGLSSSYAREGIYPKLMPRISKQLSQASPDVDTTFFDVHAASDIEHSESALKSLCHICTRDDLPEIKHSVHLGLGALLSWYNSLYLEMINDK